MTPAKFFLAASLILALSLGLAGCGTPGCATATPGNAGGTSGGTGGGSTPPQGTCTLPPGGGSSNGMQTAYVYFGGLQMAEEGLNFNNSGDFLPVSSFVSPTFGGETAGAGPMAIVNKKYLYMAFADGNVFGFSIDADTSALTALPNSPYLSAAGGSTIVADPAGRFLFVGGAAGVSAFTVSSNDGSLTVAGTGPFATGGGTPLQLATDGLGKYLYAIDGVRIAAFSYDQTSGALSAVFGSPFTALGSNSVQIAADKTGLLLFGITQETGDNGGATDNNIYVFLIGASGAPAALAPVPTADSPAFIAASPTGSFVYTFNQTFDATANGLVTDPMRGFAVNASGGMTEVSSVATADLTAAMGLFDQSGKYLFSVASIPNTTIGGEFAYAVDPSSGAVTSTLHHAGVPTLNYVVTDEP